MSSKLIEWYRIQLLFTCQRFWQFAKLREINLIDFYIFARHLAAAVVVSRKRHEARLKPQGSRVPENNEKIQHNTNKHFHECVFHSNGTIYMSSHKNPYNIFSCIPYRVCLPTSWQRRVLGPSGCPFWDNINFDWALGSQFTIWLTSKQNIGLAIIFKAHNRARLMQFRCTFTAFECVCVCVCLGVSGWHKRKKQRAWLGHERIYSFTGIYI